MLRYMYFTKLRSWQFFTRISERINNNFKSGSPDRYFFNKVVKMESVYHFIRQGGTNPMHILHFSLEFTLQSFKVKFLNFFDFSLFCFEFLQRREGCWLDYWERAPPAGQFSKFNREYCSGGVMIIRNLIKIIDFNTSLCDLTRKIRAVLKNLPRAIYLLAIFFGKSQSALGSIDIWRQMFLGYFWPTYLP